MFIISITISSRPMNYLTVLFGFQMYGYILAGFELLFLNSLLTAYFQILGFFFFKTSSLIHYVCGQFFLKKVLYVCLKECLFVRHRITHILGFQYFLFLWALWKLNSSVSKESVTKPLARPIDWPSSYSCLRFWDVRGLGAASLPRITSLIFFISNHTSYPEICLT